MATTSVGIEPPFRATYPKHLDPKEKPLYLRVYEFVKTVIFFIPKGMINLFFATSPKSRCTKKELEDWTKKPIEEHDKIAIKFKTPDDTVLHGHFMPHKQFESDSQSKILIVFANECLHYSSPAHFLQSLQAVAPNHSYLVFNSQGSGSEALNLEAESAYQFAKELTGNDESRIDLYGNSIGGSVAAKLKEAHPNTGGKLFLDRVYTRFDEHEVLPSKLGHVISKALISCSSWHYDNCEALKNVTDDVHIFQDELLDRVAESWNLAAALRKQGMKKNFFVHTFNGENFKKAAKDAMIKKLEESKLGSFSSKLIKMLAFFVFEAQYHSYSLTRLELKSTTLDDDFTDGNQLLRKVFSY